jgi:hypothetical protein
MKEDQALWKTALKRISSGYHRFPTKLGDYIAPPHKQFKWMTSHNNHVVHGILEPTGYYIQYSPTGSQTTRSGASYRCIGYMHGASDLSHYASTVPSPGDSIQLHSWTPVYSPAPPPTTFWDQIHRHDNPSLWDNLRCTGDGTWIWDGLCMNTLVIVQDGSYIKEIITDICSAIVIIYCKQTSQ